MVPDRVRFYFDPLCPWCWVTSTWMRRLEELGEVHVSWGLFSLALANEGTEKGQVKQHVRGGPSLRTAIAVRDAAGDAAVGRFYEALGRRIHELGEDAADPDVSHAALREAGLDEGLFDQAQADGSTWERVAAEHGALVQRTRSFGVPTIVLDDGEGPAIFGPVVCDTPSDDDAVELWRHVTWLTRYEPFSELKRDRSRAPALESVRRFRARLPEVDLT